MIPKDFKKLEQKTGVKFKNKELLKEALTHRSYLNENPHWPLPDNERLEFLGDAVLELVTTEFLYHTFPDYQEGELTSLRAALVNYEMMARVAKEICLDEFILLSRGEAKDLGKAREVILANSIEALIGAVYLDRGYEISKKFINAVLLKHLEEVIERKLYQDPKSLLQEIIQEKSRVTPIYKVLEESGPDHQRNFLVGVYAGTKLLARGNGFSKQEAERKAAEAALKHLKK